MEAVVQSVVGTQDLADRDQDQDQDRDQDRDQPFLAGDLPSEGAGINCGIFRHRHTKHGYIIRYW